MKCDVGIVVIIIGLAVVFRIGSFMIVMLPLVYFMLILICHLYVGLLTPFCVEALIPLFCVVSVSFPEVSYRQNLPSTISTSSEIIVALIEPLSSYSSTSTTNFCYLT